jgi:hypothetical protein
MADIGVGQDRQNLHPNSYVYLLTTTGYRADMLDE